MNIYKKIVNLQNANIPFVVVSVVSKDGHGPQIPGAKMIVSGDGKTIGTIGGGSLELLAGKEALKILSKGSTFCIKKYTMSGDSILIDAVNTGMMCGGTIDILYEPYGALETVYIFGAGHVGQAIAYHLAKLDYRTIICDCRPEYRKEISGASEIIIDDYSKILDDRKVALNSFMVIVTHSHESDFVILKRIYKSSWNPTYIGVIASKKKSETILKRLNQEAGPNIDFDKLYCPIGLKTGGATPHDIAISIVAELQAVRFGKQGHNHFKIERKSIIN